MQANLKMSSNMGSNMGVLGNKAGHTDNYDYDRNHDNHDHDYGRNPDYDPDYDNLVDIRTVKLREGATRLENALYFLEQIKNPHKFRVGIDVVEVCCVGEESLSDVLVKHFSRRGR